MLAKLWERVPLLVNPMVMTTTTTTTTFQILEAPLCRCLHNTTNQCIKRADASYNRKRNVVSIGSEFFTEIDNEMARGNVSPIIKVAFSFLHEFSQFYYNIWNPLEYSKDYRREYLKKHDHRSSFEFL